MQIRAGLLIGLAGAFPTLFADTYPRQPEVDALHYVFRLSLSDETDEIIGEAISDPSNGSIESDPVVSYRLFPERVCAGSLPIES